MSAEQQEPKERKTLDDRQKMTELERLRHSAAHVMATAIVRLWPDAQFASGPAVENGFYYDLECAHRISPEDFPAIEAEMKKEIKANHTFEKITVTREQAIADAQAGRLGGLAERPGNASKFKLDLLKQIPEGEPISYYKNGDFIDAAGETARRMPECKFLIIGDGELRPGLELQARGLCLSENLKFLGWRRDIAELLAVTDVFVMTSLDVCVPLTESSL